jgi:hypothetical protein
MYAEPFLIICVLSLQTSDSLSSTWYDSAGNHMNNLCYPKSIITEAIERNIEASSRKQCCRGKAICITYLCAREKNAGKCVRAWGCECTGTGACLRVCNLTNSACNTPPHCYLWLLWPNHIFRHYFTNDAIFGKQLSNIKCVFWFYLQIYLKYFSF